MKTFALAAMMLLSAAPALAQQAPPPAQPYVDDRCGSWVNDQWVPSSACVDYVRVVRHASIAGTIIRVQGHLVTLQQTNGAMVINDQPALSRQQTGRVAVGRQVVAYGYWSSGTFYATAIY